MATHEIARDQWHDFFQEFSNRRKGALVEVDRVSPTNGIKREVKWLPFAGIRFDSETVTVLTEGNDAHTIDNPRQVYHKSATGVMSSEETHDELIEVTTTGDPPITYLRFRPADAPTPAHTNDLES